MMAAIKAIEEQVGIDVGVGTIHGTLALPENATGAVVFAHGSGSSRHSPRNVFVAASLQEAGLATLLLDLLTKNEEQVDAFTAQHRFDIELLTQRLIAATDWLSEKADQHRLRIGYFGASTGAAAALRAAAARQEVAAVVSRGGRPDLAGDALPAVRAATLLIVGGFDHPVIPLNRAAYEQLQFADHRELVIVPGATHLFEEPGTLEEVARLAGQWFVRYLSQDPPRDDQAKGGSYGTPKTRSIR